MSHDYRHRTNRGYDSVVLDTEYYGPATKSNYHRNDDDWKCLEVKHSIFLNTESVSRFTSFRMNQILPMQGDDIYIFMH
jgi:hypothetical protein